jgi:hypothetical protein
MEYRQTVFHSSPIENERTRCVPFTPPSGTNMKEKVCAMKTNAESIVTSSTLPCVSSGFARGVLFTHPHVNAPQFTEFTSRKYLQSRFFPAFLGNFWKTHAPISTADFHTSKNVDSVSSLTLRLSQNPRGTLPVPRKRIFFKRRQAPLCLPLRHPSHPRPFHLWLHEFHQKPPSFHQFHQFHQFHFISHCLSRHTERLRNLHFRRKYLISTLFSARPSFYKPSFQFSGASLASRACSH